MVQRTLHGGCDERGVTKWAAHGVPRDRQASDEPEREVDLVVLDCPRERDAEILQLDRDELAPDALVMPAQTRPGPFGEFREVPRVPPGKRIGFLRLDEALPGVVTDRLQQPVARRTT